MKIYTTRHGETEFNLKELICGISDIDLTDTGIKQAHELSGKAFECRDIDLIICSPLKRAMQTAKIIANKINCEIITDERITEWDYGSYEGMSRHTDGFAKAKCEFGCRMKDGGESVLQLAHRVYSAIDEIRIKYHDKTVLLVCHGGVCRIIETYFNDMTTHEYANFFMGNCELREYVI